MKRKKGKVVRRRRTKKPEKAPPQFDLQKAVTAYLKAIDAPGAGYRASAGDRRRFVANLERRRLKLLTFVSDRKNVVAVLVRDHRKMPMLVKIEHRGGGGNGFVSYDPLALEYSITSKKPAQDNIQLAFDTQELKRVTEQRDFYRTKLERIAAGFMMNEIL